MLISAFQINRAHGIYAYFSVANKLNYNLQRTDLKESLVRHCNAKIEPKGLMGVSKEDK